MKIGVLGAGQLGRMLALAGIPLGLEFVFYDNKPNSCTASLGKSIIADYDDIDQLTCFAGLVDVITFEFENVPVSAVEYLEKKCPVNPAVMALRVSQDRLLEKQLFTELNIPTPDYFAIGSANQLHEVASQYQKDLIIKTRRFGYDGKGQARLTAPEQAEVIVSDLAQADLIAEQCIEFEREVSIIATRSVDEVRFYPLVENVHQQGILISTTPYNDVNLQKQAEQHALALMSKLDYIGTIAVEYFVVDGQLIANEFAPRVHNSGHWTIDAAVTSQFENHLRAILDWPLGDTQASAPFMMFNLIGELPEQSKLLSIKDAHLHDYDKTPAAKRKLGHLTLCHPDEKRIKQIQELIAETG